MKKKIKLLLIVCTLCVSVLALTGCGKKEKIDSKIIGTWEQSEEDMKYTYVLKENGTGTYSTDNGSVRLTKNLTYKTTGGILLITYENNQETVELPYTIKDNTLTIKSSNEDVIYNKK